MASYASKRQSPVLGSEAFIERLRHPGAPTAREHPRYERRVIEVGPERVINEVVRQYKVAREELFRGIRGRENEAQKVALYLVKRCCDRPLPEIAEYFGIGNYSTVSWNCRAIESQMATLTPFTYRFKKAGAMSEAKKKSK